MKLFLPALLAILALGACNKDKFGDGALDADKSASRKNNYVVYFDIRTNDDAVTRASYSDMEDAGSGDLVYGSEDEHAIGRGNFAFFFKEDNQLIAISNIYLDSHLHNTDDEGQVKDENGNLKDNIEARYAAKMELDSENLPNSCLLLLNALHLEDKLKDITDKMSVENNPATFTLTDILALVDEVGKNENPFLIGRDGEGNKYFTMSNAVYVKDNKLQTAVPIPDGFIQQTPVPDPKKALTVYVERMVAKFTFEIESKEVDNSPKRLYQIVDANPFYLFDSIDDEGSLTSIAIPWRIRLTNWGINALETKNYVFKNIDIQGSNYPSGWSDPSNFRTYWSIDNTRYTEDRYPWQYRNILDRTYNKGLDTDYPYFDYYMRLHENTDDQNMLRNYSYDDFDKLSLGEGFNRVVYVPENTYDYLSDKTDFSKRLDEREHVLAGSHLLVGAVLETDFGKKYSEGKSGYLSNDLFRDRSGIYYMSESDCFKSLVHSFNQFLSSQSAMEFTYYNWNGQGKNVLNGERYAIRPTNEDKSVRYYLYYDESPITYGDSRLDPNSEKYANYELEIATIINGDGKRLPWPVVIENGRKKEISLSIKTAEGVALTEVYTPRKNEADIWKEPIKDLIVDENVIKSLLFEWLGAIDHFSDGKMYYSAKVSNPASGEDSFFGTIRNSWYRFVLKDVTKIGAPIDDPLQPIIPLDVKTNDQINVKIEVLGWHETKEDVPMLDDKYLN